MKWLMKPLLDLIGLAFGTYGACQRLLDRCSRNLLSFPSDWEKFRARKL
jgi:hypothetical protein